MVIVRQRSAQGRSARRNVFLLTAAALGGLAVGVAMLLRIGGPVPLEPQQESVRRAGLGLSGSLSGVPDGRAALAFPDEPAAEAENLEIAKVDRAAPHQASWKDTGLGLVSAVASFSDRMTGSVLRVNRLEISGNSYLSSEAIRKLSGVSEGETWWSISKSDVVESLRNNSWIEKASVSWGAFPVVLRVHVREAEPWLVADVSGRSWLISSFGEPLQPLESIKDQNLIMLISDLPRLDGIAGEQDSSAAGTRFRLATRMLRVLEAAGGMPFHVEGYTLLPEGGLVARPLTGSDTPEVAMGIETLPQVEEMLRNLQIVLADLQKRGERPRRVDMRFGGRAVVR